MLHNFGQCILHIVAETAVAAVITRIGRVGGSQGAVVVSVMMLHLLPDAAARQLLQLLLEEFSCFLGRCLEWSIFIIMACQ